LVSTLETAASLLMLAAFIAFAFDEFVGPKR
jgi:hypothetical protein